MAETINFRDGVLTLKDNTAVTPNELTLTLEGDQSFSFDVPQRNVIVVRDRGVLDHLRNGDQQFMSFRFALKFTGMYGAAVTPYEFIYGLNNASGYTYTPVIGAGYDVSVDGGVSVVQLFAEYTAPVSGDVHTIEIPNCVCGCSFSEGDDFNVLEINGVSYQHKPIITVT